MDKHKICFVVAFHGTAKSFLTDHFRQLIKHYEVHLVANFQSESDCSFFENLGVICHNAPIQRQISLFADLKALFRLVRIFKKENFVSVHSVTPKAGLLTAFSGWISRIPHRVHIYTGQVWATQKGFMRWLLKTMDSIIAFLDTSLLVDGFGQRNFLIQEGVLKEFDSKVLANGSIAGVNLERFIISEEVREAERGKFLFNKKDVVYIYLGRLNKDKGIQELLEAFNELVIERPLSKLIFYGYDEDGYNNTIEKYSNIKRDVNFFFPGQTNEPYKALQVADVFVLPTKREGFGMSVLEAQGLGLPVITSDVYGVIDASVEDITGLRCKVNDVMSLKECMIKYYDDKNLRVSHGKAGRKRVEQLYDNEIVTEAWISYYQNMIQ